MMEHSLHFPGTQQSVVPWAQTGMSLAVVLVAFTVLALSCCGAAALILVACCSSRRRDTVAESSDSRWLPGVGIIDYVPVSNRSSVRVSLVLSEDSQEMETEGGGERVGTPTPNDEFDHITLDKNKIKQNKLTL
ncbi:hypothetical protein Pcinc_024304 [Petrolisthes cinctipes]|uniref:Uncharacterized protein n=1 Tax=Petrolisthes cinctipes TaxID=88211 RepID=A0AAE1FAV7_PETCI|nr:hypothetical protein Pcinc_024304 [Petrolisthes cinctipes]